MWSWVLGLPGMQLSCAQRLPCPKLTVQVIWWLRRESWEGNPNVAFQWTFFQFSGVTYVVVLVMLGISVCWAIYNDLSRRLVTPNGGEKFSGIPPKCPDKNQVGRIYFFKLSSNTYNYSPFNSTPWLEATHTRGPWIIERVWGLIPGPANGRSWWTSPRQVWWVFTCDLS